MKSSTLVLTASLAANLILVGVGMVRTPPASSATLARSTPAAAGAKAVRLPSAATTPANPADAAADSSAAPGTWGALETSDLKALADRLRAAGFPTSLIRTIVRIQLSDQFAGRRAALLPALEPAPFWKANSQGISADDLAMMKVSNAQRALSLEMNAAYKEALGPDAQDTMSDAARASYNRSYGDLPMEKIEGLQTVLSDYSQARIELQSSTRGVMLPEDREKLTALEQERQAALAKVLTPQELEEYNLRSSDTASILRSQLGAFNPTEDEYRALYKAQVAFDQQYGSPYNGSMTVDQQRERQSHQAELDAQIQAALSPDRAADYKQAMDPAYRQINQLVTRLELPPAAAVDVVAVQKDIQQRATALRTDRTLSANDRNQQLAALADEAKTKVTATLGDRGFEAYKSYGGTWIQNLQPRPAPPRP